MKTKSICSAAIVACILGIASRAGAAPDAGLAAPSPTASCDDKCAGKKQGDRMARLHRQGWEAAIKELSIQGDEKKKILKLSDQIEGRIKKAHAAASQSDVAKVKADATRELKNILQERYQWWQDAEHEARTKIITAESGVPPEIR